MLGPKDWIGYVCTVCASMTAPGKAPLHASPETGCDHGPLHVVEMLTTYHEGGKHQRTQYGKPGDFTLEKK